MTSNNTSTKVLPTKVLPTKLLPTKTLSTKQVERIIRNSGAERVSDDAAIYLETELVKYGTTISTLAIQFAKHAGRSTVKDQDVELAIKNIKGGL